MATTAAPIARNIRSRLRLSAAELGGLRMRTPMEKVFVVMLLGLVQDKNRRRSRRSEKLWRL
jgi:hypothetical protein